MDHVLTNTRSSQGESQVYIFCKEYISTTEKWLRKLYIYSMNYNMNINTSDEDMHDTNYINKNDTNTYTRKLHNR